MSSPPTSSSLISTAMIGRFSSLTSVSPARLMDGRVDQYALAATVRRRSPSLGGVVLRCRLMTKAGLVCGKSCRPVS